MPRLRALLHGSLDRIVTAAPRVAALLGALAVTALPTACGRAESNRAKPIQESSPGQDTPNGPVYAGIPGALPPGFVYRYNHLSVGWPVAPRHVQHPIRGPFADPRGLHGYHFGIDVSIDDAHPDPGAPPGLSHRVYALDSGIARDPSAGARHCIFRKIEVGHFEYWHVSATVANGQPVRAGQQIGWTCRGEWHVHVSEWQRFRGDRVTVDPLHRGGAFRPYVDTAPPVVSALRFVTPPAAPWHPTTSLAQRDSAQPLSATRLHGRVELRARVDDPQSFEGFLARNPAWPTQWAPYALGVVIRSAATGRIVLWRTTFREDQLPQTPYLDHYAPGTVEDTQLSKCIGPPPLRRCDGVTWLRPFSRFGLEYWDTRQVPNGRYRVTVHARDVAGNRGAKSIDVVVRNAAPGLSLGLLRAPQGLPPAPGRTSPCSPRGRSARAVPRRCGRSGGGSRPAPRPTP